MLLFAITLLAMAPGNSASVEEAERTISTKVSQWLEFAETKPDWSEDDRLKSEIVAKGQVTLWTSCIKKQRDRFSVSKESIDNIVTAVFSNCNDEETKAKRTFALMFRGLLDPTERVVKAEELLARSRQKFKEALVGFLVEKRMQK